MVRRLLLVLSSLCALPVLAAEDYGAIDRIFDDYRLDAHVPGLVYGIVIDGKLVHAAGFGVQDVESGRPAGPDSLFRIASMTKAFTALTILRLRDEGRLRLDAPVEDYVPELRGWRGPTKDSPKIRVRDLLSHAAGFVDDNPLGDRQTPMPEAEFTALLKAGVPFSHVPGTTFEYSNFGYAILGRIITNVARRPFEDEIARDLLQPLGMTSSGLDALAAPPDRRALGYRWEDDRWKREPDLARGAFGAMGGMQTSVTDYARWVAFLLSGWPPRDDDDNGPVQRASIRELSQGLGFPVARPRPGHQADGCRIPSLYAKGFSVAMDCQLGMVMGHSGGYPGYGSYVLLLPERGVGIFAFANRTYGGPTGAVWDAALALDRQGLLPPPRAVAVSPALHEAYALVDRIYQAGEVTVAPDRLALNFLLDHDAGSWKSSLARLRGAVGACDATAPLTASGALTASFRWRCEHGRVNGRILLAPTATLQLQELDLTPTLP